MCRSFNALVRLLFDMLQFLFDVVPFMKNVHAHWLVEKFHRHLLWLYSEGFLLKILRNCCLFFTLSLTLLFCFTPIPCNCKWGSLFSFELIRFNRIDVVVVVFFSVTWDKNYSVDLKIHSQTSVTITAFNIQLKCSLFYMLNLLSGSDTHVKKTWGRIMSRMLRRSRREHTHVLSNRMCFTLCLCLGNTHRFQN